jgi:drug/metabolite transporter (DMT)-like permease
MSHVNTHPRIGTGSTSTVNSSQPPPSASPSATVFVAKVIFIGIAIVASATGIVSAPLRVTLPLGLVFVMGLLGTLGITWVDRWQARRRTRRSLPRSSAPVPSCPPHTGDDLGGDESSVSVSTSTLLVVAAASSIVVLVAFLMPEELGIGLAAVGLVGLFMIRLLAPYGDDRRVAPLRRARVQRFSRCEDNEHDR